MAFKKLLTSWICCLLVFFPYFWSVKRLGCFPYMAINLISSSANHLCSPRHHMQGSIDKDPTQGAYWLERGGRQFGQFLGRALNVVIVALMNAEQGPLPTCGSGNTSSKNEGWENQCEQVSAPPPQGWGWVWALHYTDTAFRTPGRNATAVYNTRQPARARECQEASEEGWKYPLRLPSRYSCVLWFVEPRAHGTPRLETSVCL